MNNEIVCPSCNGSENIQFDYIEDEYLYWCSLCGREVSVEDTKINEHTKLPVA